VNKEKRSITAENGRYVEAIGTYITKESLRYKGGRLTMIKGGKLFLNSGF